MQIHFTLYYLYTDDLLLQIFSMINKNEIGFNVNTIVIDDEYKFNKGKELLNIHLKEFLFKSGIIIKSEDGRNSLILCITNKKNPVLSISIKYESLSIFMLNEKRFLSNNLLNSDSLIFGSANEYDFSLSEDTFDIQTYELLYGKVSPSKIKKDEDGYEYIDKNECYGHTVYIEGIGFKASWRMYFGKFFYEKLELQEKLMNYKNCNQNLLSNNIIFIELFSSPQDHIVRKNYTLLNDFRIYISLDTVLNKISTAISSASKGVRPHS